jgi:hypothetical protein
MHTDCEAERYFAAVLGYSTGSQRSPVANNQNPASEGVDKGRRRMRILSAMGNVCPREQLLPGAGRSRGQGATLNPQPPHTYVGWPRERFEMPPRR